MLNLNARGRAALTPLTLSCAGASCAGRFTFTVGDMDDLRTAAALAGWYTERRAGLGPATGQAVDFCPRCKPGRGVSTGLPYTLNLNARGCTTLKPLTVACDTPGCRGRFTFTVGDGDDLRAAAALAGWHIDRRAGAEAVGRQIVDYCPDCKPSPISRVEIQPIAIAVDDGAADESRVLGTVAGSAALESCARESSLPAMIAMAEAALSEGNGQLPS